MYHGNIMYGNHGNGTQPNNDFKVFKKHRVNEHLINLLSSMGAPKVFQKAKENIWTDVSEDSMLNLFPIRFGQKKLR